MDPPDLDFSTSSSAMASSDEEDEEADPYCGFLELKQKMAKIGKETSDLIQVSQDGKIQGWREANAEAAKLRDRFKRLRSSVCDFFNQFLLCRLGIHTLDDSAVQKLLGELKKDRIQIFLQGILDHLNEVYLIEDQLLYQSAGLKKPRPDPKVSAEYRYLLEIQERITKDEEKLQKCAEFLDSCEEETETIELLKEEAEKITMEIDDFKQRLQEFASVCYPSGYRDLAPPEAAMFQENIAEFGKEFATVQQKARDTLKVIKKEWESRSLHKAGVRALKKIEPATRAQDHVSAFNLTDLKKLQLGLTPTERYQKQMQQKLRLIEPGGNELNLSDILIDMYGYPFVEAHHMVMVYGRVLNPESETDVSSWIKTTIRNSKVSFRVFKFRGSRFYQNIPVTLRNWLFPLEAGIYVLVKRLQVIMSAYAKALEELKQWRAKLEHFKHSNDGMVPVVVYKLVELLSMWPLEEASKLSRDEQVALYHDMSFDQAIDSIHEIVLNLRFVLMVSSVTNASTISGNVLDECEVVLVQSEKELERIEGEMGPEKRNILTKKKRVDEESSRSASEVDNGESSGFGGDSDPDESDEEEEVVRVKRPKPLHPFTIRK